MLRVAGTINFGNLTAYSVIAKKNWCFREKVRILELSALFSRADKAKVPTQQRSSIIPGPFAPPGNSRPSLNITALSYSCTTCKHKSQGYEDGCEWQRYYTLR